MCNITNQVKIFNIHIEKFVFFIVSCISIVIYGCQWINYANFFLIHFNIIFFVYAKKTHRLHLQSTVSQILESCFVEQKKLIYNIQSLPFYFLKINCSYKSRLRPAFGWTWNLFGVAWPGILCGEEIAAMDGHYADKELDK